MTDLQLCKIYDIIYIKENVVKWRIKELQKRGRGHDTVEFSGSEDLYYPSYYYIYFNDMFMQW